MVHGGVDHIPLLAGSDPPQTGVGLVRTLLRYCVEKGSHSKMPQTNQTKFLFTSQLPNFQHPFTL